MNRIKKSIINLMLYNILYLCSEHKYEVVKCLQARKHICGITEDGAFNAHALKKDDIGSAVADATDAVNSGRASNLFIKRRYAFNLLKLKHGLIHILLNGICFVG